MCTLSKNFNRLQKLNDILEQVAKNIFEALPPDSRVYTFSVINIIHQVLLVYILVVYCTFVLCCMWRLTE